MGSLAAFFSRRDEGADEAVRRMLSAAPHRGSRFRTAAIGRCALGVSNPEGSQEATLCESDGWAAAVSAPIDNLEELRGRLREAPSDAAGVVLGLFRELSPVEAAGLLRGAFSATVTDGSRIWCLRDHLGFGALFYRDDGSGFHAASEAKQVVAGARISREPDLEVVEQIFYGRIDDETPCALRGVSRLPKASLMEVGPEAVRWRRYWDPEPLIETADPAPEEILVRFEKLMAQAAARVVTGADVVSLSGGIDSPAIAAFAAPEHLRVSGRPLAALSTVYPGMPSVDEGPYIAEVASFLHLPLITLEHRGRSLATLRDWVEVLDGPVPSLSVTEAPEFYGRAQELGYRTVLTGELAEFLVDMRRHLLVHLLLRGRLPALREHIAGQLSKGVSPLAVGKQLVSGMVPRPVAGLQARVRRISGKGMFPDWLDPGKVIDVPQDLTQRAGSRWRHEQISAFIGPGLTMEADEVRQEMFGLRVRRPWADVDLWEFFLSLPAEVKLEGVQRKALLRRLLRGRVPDSILDRTDKTYFDEALMTAVDYPSLRRWLIEPEHRIPGVSYEMLAERLEREDLELMDLIWAKDLAAVHAFLDLW